MRETVTGIKIINCLLPENQWMTIPHTYVYAHINHICLSILCVYIGIIVSYITVVESETNT